MQFIDIDELDSLIARAASESVYLIDVRTRDEFEEGAFRVSAGSPGGQAVQRADEVAPVHNAPIVFCCDGRARAALTASWYRQMGFCEVYAVRGGTELWRESGRALESGASGSKSMGLATLSEDVAASLRQTDIVASDATVIHVGLSAEFARAHIPASVWIPRGWLEIRVVNAVPDKSAALVVTCDDGSQSALAAATLSEMGYSDVAFLRGGMRAWQSAEGAIESGLSGVMSAPNDMLASGPERGFADMINYLRWEEELGHKYAAEDG